MLFDGTMEVKVAPTSSGHLAIQWAKARRLGGLSLRLCVSTSPGAPRLVLSESLSETGYFVDETSNVRHRDRLPSYFFEYTDPSGMIMDTSPAYTLTYEPDIAYLSYLVEAERALQKIDGVAGVALILKREGERCPSCWNVIEAKRMKDYCPVCFGTGWDGGYWDPISFTFRYLRMPSVGQINLDGAPTYDSVYQVQALYYPALLEGDVIVDTHNAERFRVHTIELVTYRSSFPVFQNITAIRIPKSDALHALTIPEEFFKKHRPLKAAPVVM